MAVVFQLRGTSLTAHRSFSGPTPGLFTNDANGVAAVAVDAGAFGGSSINMKLASGTAQRGLIYPGLSNLSANAAITILIRFTPNWTGNPAQSRSLFQITSGLTSVGFGTCRGYITTGGKIHLWFSRTSDGLDCFDVATTASFAPTSGTPTEIMFSWDGTTTANAMKYSIDGVELETKTATRARTVDVKFTPGLIIGGNYNQTGLNGDLQEFTIWDTAENHVYATRSDFTTATAFDGTNNTSPGAGNVKSGTTWVLNGVTQTGTLALGGGGHGHLGTPRIG